ncbi:MAG: hypothetical protein B6D54_00070 [Epsilonproteobacteria bacterium 4484_65]|nr:MAG: hypothetical protein B6D54_00070 [Epsilonproteobacteria bacterium 4484_65]
MQLFRLLLSLLGLLLVMGCQEDFPTYSTFCDQETMSLPKCLHYAVLNKQDKDVLEKHFGVIDDPRCAYRVELTKYHVGSCNNPIVKSTGSDFYGYVRIEIKKGFKCYYKVQSDYKNDVDAAFERVLKKVKIDLNQ